MAGRTRILIALGIILANFLASLVLLFVFRQLLNFQLFEELLISSFFVAIFLFIVIYFTRRFFEWSKNDCIHFYYSIVIGSLLFTFIAPNSILNIDRSRSFYVLSWVNQNEISFTHEGNLIIHIKSPEGLNKAGVKERVIEQVRRGLIDKDSGQLTLTTKGRLLLRLSNLLAKIYSLDGWFMNRS